MDVGNNIKVDDGGNFTFSKGTASVFDAHVLNSVPLYCEGHQYIAYLSDYFVKSNSVCYDLGCSTGTLLNILAERHKSRKNIRFIGIDPEAEMIEKAKEKNNYTNIEFCIDSVENIQLESCDFITSYYTMQFIPINKRQYVYNKIYSSLKNGGAFILYEKELIDDPYISKIIESAYMKFKLKNSFTFDEVLGKKFSLEGFLIPNTSDENMNLLTSAGFNSIQSIMQYGEFKGYLAIKR